MLFARLFAAVTLAVAPLAAADVCNPQDFQGPYVFQLAGETTISGAAQAASSLGRIVLDGNGGVSGSASAMFAGLLLGNPVTGTYEAHWDCTVTWNLQDDSGAFQHFAGVAKPGGSSIEFRQTDPGGVQQGLMKKVSQVCKISDLAKRYGYTLSGSSTAAGPGEAAGEVSAEGEMTADDSGNFKLTRKGNSAETDVTIAVNDDCTVDLVLLLPAEHGSATTTLNLQGVLTTSKQILAMQTDAGAMVAAKFTAH